MLLLLYRHEEGKKAKRTLNFLEVEDHARQQKGAKQSELLIGPWQQETKVVLPLHIIELKNKDGLAFSDKLGCSFTRACAALDKAVLIRRRKSHTVPIPRSQRALASIQI